MLTGVVSRAVRQFVTNEAGVISVLLVDDQAKVRQGLRMRLAMEADLSVLGEAADGHSALALALELRPDVVVMDLEMPGMDGITATAALGARCPGTAVVILSMHADQTTRLRALEAGAAAFVEKRASGPALLEAIRRAAGAQ
jgi:DNA-binding NarL/FixJ family response regulator